MRLRSTFGRAFVVTLTLAVLPTLGAAQDRYRQPPAPIAQMLDAEPLPGVSLSPARDKMLLLHRASMPPIAEVAAPFLRLAGERINPRTNGSWYEGTIIGLTVRAVAGGSERKLALPKGARLSTASWAPDGAHVSFVVRGDSSLTLWVADVATGATRQLMRLRLNGLGAAPCSWLNAASLLCRTVAANRGAPPAAPSTPVGPVIQETEGPAAANATYQDLLQNATDEAQFDYYFTSQPVVVTLDGTVRPIGKPGLYALAVPSPDGKFILVQAIHRPYSYQVPRGFFPTRTEIWSLDGRVVRMLAERELQERIGRSFDAVEAGLRSPSWRADAPATVYWVEALDGGDPAANVPKHDRVRTLPAPFTGEARTLADLEYRYGGVVWGRDDLALVNESLWKTRRSRTWAINPSAPDRPPRAIFDLSFEDTYGDPGFFLTTPNAFGRPVLLTTADGQQGYLTGGGASPEGNRPFLDRYDFTTGKTERLFRSQAPYYEAPVVVLDRGGTRFVTRRESTKDVPNYQLRDLTKGTMTALTTFTDPAPQFAGVTSELITYTRADGVQLSATLYLPPGFDKTKGPLPFFLWAYPQEFKSAAAASQVTGSPYFFTRPSGPSHLFLLTQGYGVLDGPTMPIVGEGDKEPNDTYIQQLVSSAQAAVDKIVSMGVADRDRIAVGGHSYGAFMTANLLAHSTLFRAGIARSGAYNRTLTPFGFQAEERNYWKARDTYMTMSPFNYADSLNAPILLIHGIADDNTGTFPVQSERFFAALKGNGKKARLVMLPSEPHGYRSRESNGHVLWEMVNWLDRYVKPLNKPKAN